MISIDCLFNHFCLFPSSRCHCINAGRHKVERFRSVYLLFLWTVVQLWSHPAGKTSADQHQTQHTVCWSPARPANVLVLICAAGYFPVTSSLSLHNSPKKRQNTKYTVKDRVDGGFCVSSWRLDVDNRVFCYVTVRLWHEQTAEEVNTHEIKHFYFKCWLVYWRPDDIMTGGLNAQWRLWGGALSLVWHHFRRCDADVRPRVQLSERRAAEAAGGSNATHIASSGAEVKLRLMFSTLTHKENITNTLRVKHLFIRHWNKHGTPLWAQAASAVVGLRWRVGRGWGRMGEGGWGWRGVPWVCEDPAQLAPAVAGGAGGAGAGSGSGPGAGAGAGSGTMKQPLLCHCMSRTRRTDWIWGAGASQSFQCLKSPLSKMNWRPL